jgi:hypothetical protein
MSAFATSAIWHASTSLRKTRGSERADPHWREYNTTSRRTSLVIDPPDGRLPQRTSQARPTPLQRCGSLQRGEPCDTYEDYGLEDSRFSRCAMGLNTSALTAPIRG